MTFFFNICGVNRKLTGHERPTSWSSDEIHRYPEWLNEIVEYNERNTQSFHPSIRELEDLIENNARIRLLVSGVCDELSEQCIGRPEKARGNIIRSAKDLIHLLNYMIRVPPLWNNYMFTIGLEASPFYLLLRDAMHTECGFTLFLDPHVNVVIGRIMNAWGAFLQSPASTSCLDDSPTGWFNREARQKLTAEADVNDQGYTFEEMYICSPGSPHLGFGSWDDYFTREFRPGIRPVAGFDDDNVIANVCESRPWRISRHVNHEDRFWAKGGPYSIKDMLVDGKLSEPFVGGTVYQAYLSALAYHRWHAPVNGKIVRAHKVPGTYFSEPLHHGFGSKHGHSIDEGDVNWQQSYLSAVATRAVIFIEADNPAIGLMAVILIGMAEVSSCELTVVPGQRIEKGAQLGLFHFGGSTHCVLFRPGVEISGLPDPATVTHNIPVKSQLGSVSPRPTSLVDLGEKSLI